MAYQWQVDNIFFYGYRCCMKKHGITDDIPNIPLDDEDKAILGDEVGQNNGSTMGKCSSWWRFFGDSLIFLLVLWLFWFLFLFLV